MPTIRILAVTGSLRRGSYTTLLVRASAELAPAGVTVDVMDLHGIPLFDEDLAATQGMPVAVRALYEAMAAADAVFFATPEYNHSLPGVLKNALDWISRAGVSPLRHKPVAVTGASAGLTGTLRAQMALRQVLQWFEAATLAKPEVLVGSVKAKFDTEGRLTDEPTRKHLAQLIAALADAAAARKVLATA